MALVVTKWFGFSKHHYSLDSCQSLSYIHHMVSFLFSIEAKNSCVFRKMEKSEFRALIKQLYLKGLIPKEMKAELNRVHGTSAPVIASVRNWVNEFKRGRTSTNDEHRSGRSVEVTAPEMVHKILDMVLSDHRIKVRGIVEATGHIARYSVINFARKIGCEKNLRLFWHISVAILMNFYVDT